MPVPFVQTSEHSSDTHFDWRVDFHVDHWIKQPGRRGSRPPIYLISANAPPPLALVTWPLPLPSGGSGGRRWIDWPLARCSALAPSRAPSPFRYAQLRRTKVLIHLRCAPARLDIHQLAHILPPGGSGGRRWIRTIEGVSQQIYSLPRLAASVHSRPGREAYRGFAAESNG